MKKKEYINPELEVIKIQSMSAILTGSETKELSEEETNEYDAPTWYDFGNDADKEW